MIRFVFLLLISLIAPALAQRVTPLASEPDWKKLEAYQETMTREEFTRLLDTVYAPAGAATGVIEVREKDALIFTRLAPRETIKLRFAKDAASARKAPRYWRSAPEARVKATVKRPLSGVRIALDPGHIGGEWGLMEERSFAKPGDKPVQEGDLTLAVAKHAAIQLRALGATVYLLRSEPAPTSPYTVDALRIAARKDMELSGILDIVDDYDSPRDPQKTRAVQWHAERLFYRVAEIRERARRVNTQFQPDLVVCIHFNADDWLDHEAPVFTPRNDLHTLLHGCYSAGELRFDDQRLEMLLKLLGRTHVEELAAARPINDALRKATQLPPFLYTTANAIRVDGDDYLWARNLLANRLYRCPVVFLEPYRMNHEDTYARIQAGDYPGAREVSGIVRPSIIREYADAIVAGLRSYYAVEKKAKP